MFIASVFQADRFGKVVAKVSVLPDSGDLANSTLLWVLLVSIFVYLLDCPSLLLSGHFR